MNHRACLVPAVLAAAVLLTGCGAGRDRRDDGVVNDAREMVTDAVDDGRDFVSDAAENGRELASDVVSKGREIASWAADDVSDAMDKTDSDGAYRTDPDGRVRE